MIRITHLPLVDINVSDPFGERDLTVNGVHYWWHNGIDFSAREGTLVYAVSDGVVKEAKENPGGYGLYIAIDHGKFGSLSAHLSKILVAKNQVIKRGDVIGLSGNTGASTAPHLHFELRDCEYKYFWTRGKQDTNVYLRCVDPLPYIQAVQERIAMTKAKAMQVVQKATGYNDSTMNFLDSYIYRDDLLIKAANAII